jgi:dTDP-4-dehydrorhamnose 3,5-epimerase
METIATAFEGLIELRPKVFADDRGWFVETYKQSSYLTSLRPGDHFSQDNLSCSSKGVLRGLHFQSPPYAQSKLVTVIHGKALDVVVDLRKSSATFGQHFAIVLDSKIKNQLFVPRGFAHGFIALEEDTFLLYKCDNEYNSDSETTLLWKDPSLSINWGVREPLVSPKDAQGLLWSEFNSPFD